MLKFTSYFHYSVNDQKSFTNVTSRWIPEIRHFCPDAATLVVATKRDDTDELDTDLDQEASIT